MSMVFPKQAYKIDNFKFRNYNKTSYLKQIAARFIHDKMRFYDEDMELIQDFQDFPICCNTGELIKMNFSIYQTSSKS